MAWKSLAEIAEEYKRNLAQLKARRDMLTALLAHEADVNRRLNLRRRIVRIERMIYSTATALYAMEHRGG